MQKSNIIFFLFLIFSSILCVLNSGKVIEVKERENKEIIPTDSETYIGMEISKSGNINVIIMTSQNLKPNMFEYGLSSSLDYTNITFTESTSHIIPVAHMVYNYQFTFSITKGAYDKYVILKMKNFKIGEKISVKLIFVLEIIMIIVYVFLGIFFIFGVILIIIIFYKKD